MSEQVKIICGYRAVYRPKHPLALAAPLMYGWVYEHRLVAEEELGRPLRPGEEVHHLDQDRSNNLPNNLIVLEGSQHKKLHAWLRKHFIVPVNNPGSGWNYKNCPNCDKQIPKDSVYCSPECSAIGRRVAERPDKEQLTEDIQSLSLVKIGEKYGVSDNAVRKWAKAMEIPLK